MLLDNHPAYPMSCFIELIFKGSFHFDIFTAAANTAVRLHPLLTSTAKETPSGFFRWVPHESAVRISEVPFEANRRLPAAEGIDLFTEPPLKMTVCRQNTETTQVTVEVHHSACDAAGAFRFVEDVLCEYAQQQGACSTQGQREEVKPELLNRRGKYGLTPAVWLRIFPKQIWGLYRAWMFLFNRIRPLIPAEVLLDEPKPHRFFPAVVSRVFDEQETQQIRCCAKDAGLTLNDAALAAAFLSMKNFDACNAMLPSSGAAQSGYWRIAVPTNLRTNEDRLMPAANIVSMVFIDRKAHKIADTEAFWYGIHREMQHIKRCHLGLALIHGLRVYRYLFGSFTKMIRRDKCWTTATVSNLGVLFDKLPLQKKDGKIQLGGNLELSSVFSVPPIRPQTLLGICILTYADRMSVCVHYDSAALTQSEAEKLLACIADKITNERTNPRSDAG